jgi:hypothetical protein
MERGGLRDVKTPKKNRTDQMASEQKSAQSSRRFQSKGVQALYSHQAAQEAGSCDAGFPVSGGLN